MKIPMPVLVILIIVLAALAAGYVFWNDIVSQPTPEAPAENAPNTETPATSTDQTETPTSERVTTEAIAKNYALSFLVPADAEYSVEGPQDRYHKVLHAGAANEPPALTDGYTVTMTLLAKDPEVSLRAFVDAQLPDISNATAANPAITDFYGNESYQFAHETELGNTATEHFVRVDDETVARITVSSVGERAQQYRADIEEILRSIEFPHTGNQSDVSDRIRLNAPTANQVITSPLTIAGEARGTWYFEATFSVVLTDWDGRIIAEHYATADGEWMTEAFVPFETELEFASPYQPGDPEHQKRGTLILQKANPSGLPENDEALEIPVRFAQ